MGILASSVLKGEHRNVGKTSSRCPKCAIFFQMARDGTPNRHSLFHTLGREVFLAREMPPASLARAEGAGEVVRLARGLYTFDTISSPEAVTLRNLWRIIGLLVPGAVITDRSVRRPDAPGVAGTVFLVSPDVAARGRTIDLPGVRLEFRRGPGAVVHDMPLPAGVSIASTGRGLLENARLTRGRGERISPTLSRPEIEEWIDTLYDERGEQRFLELRDQVKELAPILGLEEESKLVDSLMGAVLGTRDVRAESPRLRARQKGLAYDAHRVELFRALYDELTQVAPRTRLSRIDDPRVRYLPFFDAYFSNYIEGTEFTVAEARDIVFNGVIPAARPADARDVLGTYLLLADAGEIQRLPSSFDDYLDLLRHRHWRMLEQRPEANPGEFKSRANRAGQTEFVAPDHVKGTLAQGYSLYERLVDPFARAVFQSFLISEVHPFTDGNGRISRVMMNAELAAADETRIIIPSVYRTEYLGSLRALSHNANPTALLRVLDFAQKYAHSIDFSDFDNAAAELEATNAFVDYTEAEVEGIRLRLPQASSPA